MKTIKEIRTAFQHIHAVACGKSDRAYMSIPADEERDADLVLTAAIDELAAARARIVELEQIRDFLQRANGERLEESRAARAKLAQVEAEASAKANNEAQRAFCDGFESGWHAGRDCAAIVMEDKTKLFLFADDIRKLPYPGPDVPWAKEGPRRTHSSEGRPYFRPETTYKEMLSGKSPDPRETEEAAGNRSDRHGPTPAGCICKADYSRFEGNPEGHVVSCPWWGKRSHERVSP